MPIQVLQRGPGLGARLGESLGMGAASGLGSGLQQLANLKMQQMQANQIGQAYESVGLPRELAYLPKEAQKSLFGALVERGGLGQLGGVSEEPSRLQELPFLPQQMESREHMPSLSANQLNNMRLVQNLEEALGGKKVPEFEIVEGPQQFVRQPKIEQGKKPTIKEVLQRPTLKEQAILRKEQAVQQKEADKETKQFFLDTSRQAEAAKKSDLRLNRMEQLIEKGSLPISSFYNMAKGLAETESLKGVPLIGGILNPIANAVGYGLREIQRNITSRDTEEFEKLSNQFIDQAKAMFGSRVTDADLRAFMATVPTLAQTDAGKRQIIESMRSANKAAILKDKVAKQIIRENSGHRPFDLEILVQERIQPELDKLAKDFIGQKSLSLI